MDVSVIYVNYHTSALILDSLKTLVEKTDGVTYEVIIVDNDTEPDLPGRFRTLFPEMELKFVMLKENIGFGRANNEGVKIARGRNVFFLNPDTLLVNNAVGELSDYLDKNPETGVVGGNLTDEKGMPMLSFRRLLPGINWEINELLNHIPEKIRYGRNLIYNYGTHPIEVGYVTGADLMMPMSVVDATGGFSDDFFMYYEETDLCWRVKKLGYGIKCVPTARIIHLEGGSFGPEMVNPARIKRSEVSRRIFYRRNISPWKTRLADFIYRMFLKSRVLLKRDEKYRARYKIYKGLIDNSSVNKEV